VVQTLPSALTDGTLPNSPGNGKEKQAQLEGSTYRGPKALGWDPSRHDGEDNQIAGCLWSRKTFVLFRFSFALDLKLEIKQELFYKMF
jgi:hypothetical protein